MVAIFRLGASLDPQGPDVNNKDDKIYPCLRADFTPFPFITVIGSYASFGITSVSCIILIQSHTVDKTPHVATTATLTPTRLFKPHMHKAPTSSDIRCAVSESLM